MPVAFLFVLVVLLIPFILIKLLWAWTIPDLFPGAVEQGLVADSISWFTSFKIAIFVAVISTFFSTFFKISGVKRAKREG